ncbi:hypothetical protein Sipo8835_40305 [Streptomyces ipomoeae]|jgi:hypothetical protein|uniref:Integral membrane family protein n=2 Tax=Streptomyces ipomoeae TaxID=103232 RepID=L1KW86_9ACTN|nr:hypothetical protein [Streptomyces ipomoeae]EKX64789.1 integral membrane family protein [Streptomyces ipomoeae 91-03]MDX2695560.1 hypothetical protein [Streptomyces ipomoeae]MDX2823184.1 hypothetical protein [Streptomyces ipomoeae]MDX2842328.1 hypothetical protein [Streptomyces ipomoeae]MDX2876497.1 hypothetical protein [Streptomyces ipomoeae]
MAMPSGLRKFALTTHVASSVGWLGSVAAFLVLAVVGLTGEDAQRVRGAYLALEVTGWYVIVPLAFASLLTGLLQSLGTTWGLLRHYWVLAKLALTVMATFLLLLHMQVVDHVANTAARTNLSGSDLGGMRAQLVFDAAAAVVVLLTTTALSVYKPRGITRYGWRVQQEQRAERAGGGTVDTAAPARA